MTFLKVKNCSQNLNTNSEFRLPIFFPIFLTNKSECCLFNVVSFEKMIMNHSRRLQKSWIWFLNSLLDLVKSFSMITLLTHTVAHSTKPSFLHKTNNHPLKKFLSLALSWAKVVKINGKILTFKVNFLRQKISESF